MKYSLIKIYVVGVDGRLFYKLKVLGVDLEYELFHEFVDSVSGKIHGIEKIENSKLVIRLATKAAYQKARGITTKTDYEKAINDSNKPEDFDQEDDGTEKAYFKEKNNEINPSKAYVYIMVNESMPGLVKVGFTKRDVEERCKELSSQTSVPEPFKIHKVFPVPIKAGAEAERVAHRALQRFPQKKEFFRCCATEAAEVINFALLNKFTAAPTIDVHKSYCL